MEPENLNGDWITGEAHRMSVSVSDESTPNKGPVLRLTLHGTGDFQIGMNGWEWATYREVVLQYAPAGLFLYKILFIPVYALEGVGKTFAQGNPRHLNSIIVVDLLSRLSGHMGRRAPLVREILKIQNDDAKVRFDYFRNLYNWTEWFSPFLGTGVLFFGEEKEWHSIGLAGRTIAMNDRRVRGRKIYLKGKIPLEFIESITLRVRSDDDTSTGEAFLVIQNPAGNSSRLMKDGSTNEIAFPWSAEISHVRNIEIKIVDRSGTIWRGHSGREHNRWRSARLSPTKSE